MIRGFGPKKKSSRKSQRRPIPFQRVTAEIKLDSTQEIAESRVFLNDLSPTGVGCFVNLPVDKGEKVSIVIEQPKPLFVKGEVIWCSPYSLDTKVISPDAFKYRIGIKFHFESSDEQAAVKKYCEELYTNSKDAG